MCTAGVRRPRMRAIRSGHAHSAIVIAGRSLYYTRGVGDARALTGNVSDQAIRPYGRFAHLTGHDNGTTTCESSQRARGPETRILSSPDGRRPPMQRQERPRPALSRAEMPKTLLRPVITVQPSRRKRPDRAKSEGRNDQVTTLASGRAARRKQGPDYETRGLARPESWSLLSRDLGRPERSGIRARQSEKRWLPWMRDCDGPAKPLCGAPKHRG